MRTRPGKRPDLLTIVFPYDDGEYLIWVGYVQVDEGRIAVAGRSDTFTCYDAADSGVLALMFSGLRSSQSLGVGYRSAENQDGC